MSPRKKPRARVDRPSVRETRHTLQLLNYYF
jgi:hypothetical protein